MSPSGDRNERGSRTNAAARALVIPDMSNHSRGDAMTKARNCLVAILAGVTMLAAAALIAGDNRAAAAQGAGDRVARASVDGGWGSAHIYWRPHGRGPDGSQLYDVDVRGAVRDTKGDNHAVALEVSYRLVGSFSNGAPRLITKTATLATARGKGRFARGRWGNQQVRDVAIRACTTSFLHHKCGKWR
jgi:hypothetical protein